MLILKRNIIYLKKWGLVDAFNFKKISHPHKIKQTKYYLNTNVHTNVVYTIVNNIYYEYTYN